MVGRIAKTQIAAARSARTILVRAGKDDPVFADSQQGTLNDGGIERCGRRTEGGPLLVAGLKRLAAIETPCLAAASLGRPVLVTRVEVQHSIGKLNHSRLVRFQSIVIRCIDRSESPGSPVIVAQDRLRAERSTIDTGGPRAMVGGNDQAAAVGSLLQLNRMNRSGRVPAPTLAFHRRGDFATRRPTGTVVITADHKDAIVFDRKWQPDSTRVLRVEVVDHGCGITNGDLSLRIFQQRAVVVAFLHDLQLAPRCTVVS